MEKSTDPAWRRLPPEALRKLHWITLVLEEEGRPLTAAEIAGRLRELGVVFDVDPVTSVVKAVAGRGPILKVGDKTYVFDPRSEQMEAIRTHVNIKLWESGLVPHPYQELSPEEKQERWEEMKRQEREELGRVRAEYRSWRKVFLRTVFSGRKFLFGATLDRDSREFVTFSDADDFRRWLVQTDLILGFSPDDQLRKLDLFPPPGRVVDITPPIRSRVVNKSGRKVHFSLDYVLKNNTGRTVSPDSRLKEYHGEGATAKLTRRIFADLKTMFILYLYGQAHGYLNLDWGFVHDARFVTWGDSRWEPGIVEIISDAIDAGGDVEIIYGHRPSWEDLWAHAWRVHPLEVNHFYFHFETAEGGGVYKVSPAEIFLARLTE